MLQWHGWFPGGGVESRIDGSPLVSEVGFGLAVAESLCLYKRCC
jgi:hypothetical protein